VYLLAGTHVASLSALEIDVLGGDAWEGRCHAIDLFQQASLSNVEGVEGAFGGVAVTAVESPASRVFDTTERL
jgi:hypothetical protein